MSSTRLAALVVATLVVSAAAQVPMPAPSGAVNDFAGVLTADEERAPVTLVSRVEKVTTAEIAVVTIPSLNGMTVEEYATRLFEAWGIGQADTDNGVLILVAPTEREMRIEVGYGLEGVPPDGLAGQIVRETFLPAFGDNRYGAGIVEGTIGFGMIGAGLAARAFTGVVGGLIFGVVPMLIVQAFTEGPAAWGVSTVALVATLVGYRIGRRPSYRRSLRGTGVDDSRWMWGGNGSSSDSGSSGDSSGGSSSDFGGGSSGGGGASGRW